MDLLKRRFVMMAIPQIIVYGLYLYLLLGGISTFFGGINGYSLTGIVIAILILNYVPQFIETMKSTIITRTLLSITEVWKWMALMYGFLTLAIYIINLAFKIPNEILIAIYLSIVPILSIYAYIKAHKIVITPYTLKIANLKEEVKILHLSDLHIGSIRNNKLLKDVADKISSVEADIAIISGDLADGTCKIHNESFIPLKKSKIPIIFTPGNHDIYPGIDNVINASKNANITVLLDEKIEFKGLNIYGLPFTTSSRNQNLGIGLEESKASGLDDYDASGTNLIVNHIPAGWEYFRSIGFDLQLSGHTHGGQFYPFTFFVKLVFPYLRGLYKEDNSYLSVTDGVGTLAPPMRLGTNAEIVLLELKPL
ncbi:metallophosphoesterase [Methanobrevibacter filiformis]|uniref:Putative metallophosphoesterase n=1 Tax=Methanobrevibacter filiformis TaxID=55758 RepID=A0A166F4D9_9EURY|nr:metallophosphoesterase [Methanobrevibacter filiformis]KZX17301.1 putative metallophosphoesterase [Methanobrevibacter filiformis]